MKNTMNQALNNIENATNNANSNNETAAQNNTKETKNMTNTNNPQNNTSNVQEFSNTELRKMQFEARKFLANGAKVTNLPVNVTDKTKALFDTEKGRQILDFWNEYNDTQDKIDALPRSASPKVKEERAALTAIKKKAENKANSLIHKYVLPKEIEEILYDIAKASFGSKEVVKLNLTIKLLDALGLKRQNKTDLAKMNAKIFSMVSTKEASFSAMRKGNNDTFTASDFHHKVVKMLIVLLSKQEIREREQKKAEKAKAKAKAGKAKKEAKEQNKTDAENKKATAQKNNKKGNKKSNTQTSANTNNTKAPKTTNKTNNAQ